MIWRVEEVDGEFGSSLCICMPQAPLRRRRGVRKMLTGCYEIQHSLRMWQSQNPRSCSHTVPITVQNLQRALESRFCFKNTVWKLILIHLIFLPYTVTSINVRTRDQTILSGFLLRLFEPVQETLSAPLKGLTQTTFAPRVLVLMQNQNSLWR